MHMIIAPFVFTGLLSVYLRRKIQKRSQANIDKYQIVLNSLFIIDPNQTIDNEELQNGTYDEKIFYKETI